MILGFIYLAIGIAGFVLPWLIARKLDGVGNQSVSCLMGLLGTVFIILGLWTLFF